MSVYDKYNFNNLDTILDIAKRDKHSFLEGACVEHIFYEDIIRNHIFSGLCKPYYSTGWWRTKFKSTNTYIMFKVSINKPTKQDFYIASLFKKEKVYFFYINEFNSFIMYDVNNNVSMSLSDFMNRYNLNFCENFKADSSCIDLNRQNQAINFLIKNNLLKEYSFQRFFVNFVLGNNINDLVNIDSILLYEKNNEALAKVIEIKFKYESKKGHFGLNKGFNNLFEMILDYDIPINHYILYNGTKNQHISIIDAILDNNIKSQCCWIYSPISKNLLPNKFDLAPSKTRYDGFSSTQKFSSIPKEKFFLIKPLEYVFNYK